MIPQPAEQYLGVNPQYHGIMPGFRLTYVRHGHKKSLSQADVGFSRMETYEFKQVITKKACPQCGEQYKLTDELSYCPKDASLLVAVIDDPFVGTTLSEEYEILSVIGSGATGTVYKARQVALNRFVAIKILQAHLVSDMAKVQRFELEAKALSQLDHPNLVRIFDYGLMPQPYMVMEYIEGAKLDELLKTGPLPLSKTVEIVGQVCAGLGHAHEKGIVHRDLKPANIMLVTAESSAPVVKVLDFGLAKLIQDLDSSKPGLTRTGDVVGSPPYMSPEQCLGKIPDGRSDIYAIGCILCEMLTGARPFSALTTVEYMNKQVSASPPSLLDLKPDLIVPAAVEETVFKSLAKDPSKRFQSLSEFKENLELAAADSGGRLLSKLKVRQLCYRILGVLVVLLGALSFYLVQSGTFNDWLWRYHYDSGCKILAAKNYAQAETEFKSALDAAQRFGDEDERTLSSLDKLLVLYKHESKWDEAKKTNERIIAGRHLEDKLAVYSGNGITFSYPATWKIVPSKRAFNGLIDFTVNDTVHWGCIAILLYRFDKMAAQEVADVEQEYYSHILVNYKVLPIKPFITVGKDGKTTAVQKSFYCNDFGAHSYQRHVYFGRPGNIYKLKLQCEKMDFDHLSRVADRMLASVDFPKQTAIIHNPQDQRKFLPEIRAARLSQQGKHEQALAVIEQGLREDPKNLNLLFKRAWCYMTAKQFALSEKSYDEMIRILPDKSRRDIYKNRALVRYLAGKPEAAIADFKKVLDSGQWNEQDDPYIAIQTSFAYRQLGRNSSAKEILDWAEVHTSKQAWPLKIIQYLNGQLSGGELLALATDNDKLTEAHYYLGTDLSLSGKKAESDQHLRWVVQNGNKNFVEWYLSMLSI